MEQRNPLCHERASGKGHLTEMVVGIFCPGPRKQKLYILTCHSYSSCGFLRLRLAQPGSYFGCLVQPPQASCLQHPSLHSPHHLCQHRSATHSKDGLEGGRRVPGKVSKVCLCPSPSNALPLQLDHVVDAGPQLMAAKISSQ